MRTLLAMTRDTLLMLRRRRLFWLHFWLNIAVVLLYASVSFADKGWSFGFGLKYTENEWLRQGTPWEHTMHCWMIARIMRWWVAGGGVLLALFGTASLLPETLEPGSAALLVPRARRRSLILAGRFLGSLGYMLLQTTIVVAGLWLVIRWRMGDWHHAVWLGVPLAAVLFIPLQAVALFMGVLTRSATAALLVVILFAGSVWAVHDSAAAPETDPIALAEEAPDESHGSGLSEALTHEAAQSAATILPHSRDTLVWLEREACPQPAPRYNYRSLFRRLRVGHSGLSAVAADVIAAASATPGKKPDVPVKFLSLLISSVSFATVIMALAAWLLKRRDL
jgi:hypothetical protein